MIDLRDRRPAKPPGWDKRVQKAHDAIATLIARGTTPTVDDFDANCWRSCRKVLSRAQYGGKCAYCETRIGAGYPGDVEHYRPKTAVVSVVPGKRKGQFNDGQETRPGYWWLAYSFENLRLSCFWCNNRKGTRFPVQGEHARTPGAEKDERPLLLDPFASDPAGHVRFDERGDVHGETPMGEFTIYICGLDRPGLRTERERTAEDISRDLDDYEDAVVNRNELATQQTLRRLHDACDASARYTALARAMVKRRLGLDYSELCSARESGLI